MTRNSIGFGAIAASNAKLLILGSLPGQVSLRYGQYYAHPRNAFWPIMERLYGVSGDYEARCDALRNRSDCAVGRPARIAAGGEPRREYSY